MSLAPHLIIVSLTEKFGTGEIGAAIELQFSIPIDNLTNIYKNLLLESANDKRSGHQFLFMSTSIEGHISFFSTFKLRELF